MTELQDLARKVAAVLPEWPDGAIRLPTPLDDGATFDYSRRYDARGGGFPCPDLYDGYEAWVEPRSGHAPDLLDGATVGALLDMLPGPWRIADGVKHGRAWVEVSWDTPMSPSGWHVQERRAGADDWKTARGLAVGRAVLACFGGGA